MSVLILILKIIYALMPIVFGVFFTIYMKTGKFEIFSASLFVIIFIWGFFDCISTGLTLLGIE